MGRQGSRDIMKEKRQKEVKGLKKKSQLHTDFDCRYADMQWKIFSQCPQSKAAFAFDTVT